MRRRWWAASRFLLGVVVVMAAQFAAGGFVSREMDFLRNNLIYRPLWLLFLLVGFSIVVNGFDRVPGNPLAAFGLVLRPPWRQELWAGNLLGSGLVAVVVALIAFFGNLTIVLTTGRAEVLTAGSVLVILAAGAMAEEISFRGYPFQMLVTAVGETPAVVIVSLLFGAVHLGNPHASFWGLVDTTLIGVLLSLAYLRTRSLWLPIAIHFSWNATLGLVFGLPVSGLRGFAVITHGYASGPAWLTGGAYGIEGSAVGAMVIMAGIVVLVAVVPCRELAGSEAAEERFLVNPESIETQPALLPSAPGLPAARDGFRDS